MSNAPDTPMADLVQPRRLIRFQIVDNIVDTVLVSTRTIQDGTPKPRPRRGFSTQSDPLPAPIFYRRSD